MTLQFILMYIYGSYELKITKIYTYMYQVKKMSMKIFVSRVFRTVINIKS